MGGAVLDATSPPDSAPAPSKLIRAAAIRFLRYFSILFGLNSDHIQKEASRNFSLFLRDIVESGFQGFAPNNANKVSDHVQDDEQVCTPCRLCVTGKAHKRSATLGSPNPTCVHSFRRVVISDYPIVFYLPWL
jgi:hypothetical protein